MAHRPTWTPAEGKSDVRHHSRSYSSRQLPAHTKLKFRLPGQGGTIPLGANLAEDRRRDLRAELERRERDALGKGGSAANPDADDGDDDGGEPDGHQVNGGQSSRLRIENGQEASERAGERSPVSSGKGKEVVRGPAASTRPDDDEDGQEAENGRSALADADAESDADEDDDSDSDDDEAALLRELEKIKRERAEEKARLEREAAAKEEDERENAIALGNPLLNLENALKGGTGAVSGGGAPRAGGVAGAGMSFGVKRRWDDDVIFKNQAAGNANDGEERGFVNDLIRTDFHRKFLKRYLK